MSLDVYLDSPSYKVTRGSGIFIRENGRQKEITREEWDRAYPGREPVVVQYQAQATGRVYNGNITHNLSEMAKAAGVFNILWQPEENVTASQLIEPLRTGLESLKQSPDVFRAYNPDGGWGDYDVLVEFVEEYLAACEKWPDAVVSVWR